MEEADWRDFRSPLEPADFISQVPGRDSVWESTDDEVREERSRGGRPILYRGDPDAKHLTDQQKRQIKRRIHNRASARRMRERRQAEAECLRSEVEDANAFLEALHCGGFDAATV
ncbi:hypothetical protein WJX73_007668 [Symbiochloris irregularis]|uniref:BZIP domain-containing protein n=1 Tax=Symbiochloris irregularis TaxID=706552 RepID=A0AAW1NS69_9CHLO